MPGALSPQLKAMFEGWYAIAQSPKVEMSPPEIEVVQRVFAEQIRVRIEGAHGDREHIIQHATEKALDAVEFETICSIWYEEIVAEYQAYVELSQHARTNHVAEYLRRQVLRERPELESFRSFQRAYEKRIYDQHLKGLDI